MFLKLSLTGLVYVLAMAYVALRDLDRLCYEAIILLEAVQGT